MQARAGWTKKAYEAAEKAEKAQSEINQAHFKYAGSAAKSALATAKAVGEYGNTLQGLRAEYGAIAGRYDNAVARAEDAFRHNQLEFYGVLSGSNLPGGY